MRKTMKILVSVILVVGLILPTASSAYSESLVLCCIGEVELNVGDTITLPAQGDVLVTYCMDELETILENHIPFPWDFTTSFRCCADCEYELRAAPSFEIFGIDPSILYGAVVVIVPVYGDPTVFTCFEDFEQYKNNVPITPFSNGCPTWCPGGRIQVSTQFSAHIFTLISTTESPPNFVHLHECQRHRYHVTESCSSCGTRVRTTHLYRDGGCRQHTVRTSPMPPSPPPGGIWPAR